MFVMPFNDYVCGKRLEECTLEWLPSYFRHSWLCGPCDAIYNLKGQFVLSSFVALVPGKLESIVIVSFNIDDY